MIWDYIIIGGGISGLYTAYQLEKKYPSISILILEKESYLGGRTRTTFFHGTSIVKGAGIGRFQKDVLLKQLQSFVGSTKEISTKINYSFENAVDTLYYISILKKKVKNMDRSRYTFRECFLHFFSKKEYELFCQSNGFTDFENADIIDTLYDYGFEDNTPHQKIFRVEWNKIIRYLKSQLKQTKIQLKTEFLSLENFTIYCSKQRHYKGKNIIFAGSIEKYPYPFVHQQIGYNSFLRLYVLWKDGHSISNTMYLDNEFQKRIPITKHIELLSYSDNKNAEKVKTYTQKQLEIIWNRKMKDLISFYWKRGTHFYRPLDTIQYKDRDDFIFRAQNPEPHIFLVGEVISRNQGWTEGALESVHRILPLL